MLDNLMRKAVFLDRDGVINRAIVRDGKPYPPASLAEMEILPGVASALDALRQQEFLLIVITNQPDVAKSITSQDTVEAIHDYMSRSLSIDEFRTRYHEDRDGCDCRKPSPGLLLAAAKAHHINLSQSYMVGDRWRDTEAGQRAGCKTIFIDYGYHEKQPDFTDFRVESLNDAVKLILLGYVQ